MQITLYVNSSERQAINKTISNGLTLLGSLRNESSIINPIILIEIENPSSYNYAYIPEFGRYYFITDMVSVRTDLWRISMNVDVLMSFAFDILNLDVIVSDLSIGEEQASTYFTGTQWQSTVKTKTDVISFPSGLLDNGEYILITSGGIAGSQNSNNSGNSGS